MSLSLEPRRVLGQTSIYDRLQNGKSYEVSHSKARYPRTYTKNVSWDTMGLASHHTRHPQSATKGFMVILGWTVVESFLWKILST